MHTFFKQFSSFRVSEERSSKKCKERACHFGYFSLANNMLGVLLEVLIPVGGQITTTSHGLGNVKRFPPARLTDTAFCLQLPP